MGPGTRGVSSWSGWGIEEPWPNKQGRCRATGAKIRGLISIGGARPQRGESFLSAPLARSWTIGAGTSFQKERGVAVYAWGAWKEGRHARRHVHRGRRRSRHGFPAPL